jgi:hypothetical protein
MKLCTTSGGCCPEVSIDPQTRDVVLEGDAVIDYSNGSRMTYVPVIRLDPAKARLLAEWLAAHTDAGPLDLPPPPVRARS